MQQCVCVCVCVCVYVCVAVQVYQMTRGASLYQSPAQSAAYPKIRPTSRHGLLHASRTGGKVGRASEHSKEFAMRSCASEGAKVRVRVSARVRVRVRL